MASNDPCLCCCNATHFHSSGGKEIGPMTMLRNWLRAALAGLAAAACACAAPAIGQEKTFKVVMHSDLKVLDPVWSGAYIVRNHGYLIYDTLFALDASFKVQPQMAQSWRVSEDGLTTTITLREGLLWHDGTPVTSADCIASLKRWSVRDSMGLKLAEFLKEYRVVDDRTFEIVLKERFGALLEAIGKPSVVVPFMMPKRVADTDPFQQISDYTGSGPFVLKKEEWQPGVKVVYVKNPNYKPRAEPPSGLAGGKVVKVDRVEWVWIPDAQTQVNSLLSGEVDMIESVSHDLLPLVEKDKSIRTIKSTASNQYVFRMNWLQPPFNNAKIRQAAFVALKQQDFLEAVVGNPKYWRTCKALFTCGSPLATEAGMDGLLDGNAEKAGQMLKEAGYDGTPVVLLQSTDVAVLTNLAPVAKRLLERAGFKVEMQSMDWQSLVNRVTTKKGPPSEGGWNAFATSWVQVDILDPLMTPYLAATCDKARAGWPCDEAMEKVRDSFARATQPADKKHIAEEAQVLNTRVVTHIPLGEWFVVAAVRGNVETLAQPPPVTVFWGLSKR
jgi:peptide/nickel transport system substrate-binding protein